MKKKKVIYVSYANFCEWYFDGDRDSNGSIVKDLIDFRTISVDKYANEVGYLPVGIILNLEVVDKNDIFHEEVVSPEKYEIKLK